MAHQWRWYRSPTAWMIAGSVLLQLTLLLSPDVPRIVALAPLGTLIYMWWILATAEE